MQSNTACLPVALKQAQGPSHRCECLQTRLQTATRRPQCWRSACYPLHSPTTRRRCNPTTQRRGREVAKGQTRPARDRFDMCCRADAKPAKVNPETRSRSTRASNHCAIKQPTNRPRHDHQCTAHSATKCLQRATHLYSAQVINRMSRPFRTLRWQRPLGSGRAHGRVLDSAPSLRGFPQQGRRRSCRLLVPAISGCCSLPLRLRWLRGGMCVRSRPSLLLTGRCPLPYA
ncbi:hypothetical protein XBLMG947_2092 [Xanthomonas bromi]|uniref:Uncharacterized protein n=1 Tax=Xanthomonas bromi TaxID=56449 RepID=A0A1C3NLW2_9XANT|nr:hypothetical protein XBLMG947_2092 [Xanthomonas bromi]